MHAALKGWGSGWSEGGSSSASPSQPNWHILLLDSYTDLFIKFVMVTPLLSGIGGHCGDVIAQWLKILYLLSRMGDGGALATYWCCFGTGLGVGMTGHSPSFYILSTTACEDLRCQQVYL